MINVQQIHIDFTIKLGRIDGKIRENFQPPEIDWLFNDSVIKYIESNFIPKRELGGDSNFQDTKAKYDNLEELVELARLTPLLNDVDEDSTSYVNLPPNYFKIIDDASEIIARNCDLYLNNIVAKVNSNYKIAVVDLNDTNTPSLNYRNLVITASNLVSLNYDTLYSVITNTNEEYYFNQDRLREEDKYEIIEDILRVVNKNTLGIKVYWEKYDNVFHNNKFIFVDETGNYNTIKVHYKTGDATKDKEYNFVNINKKIRNTNLNKDLTTSNRLVKSEYVESFLYNSLLKPRYDSLISELRKGRLYVYHNKQFIPKTVILRYLRRPQKIDFNRSFGSDLNKNVYDKVVDLAVERVAEAIQTNNLKGLLDATRKIE